MDDLVLPKEVDLLLVFGFPLRCGGRLLGVIQQGPAARRGLSTDLSTVPLRQGSLRLRLPSQRAVVQLRSQPLPPAGPARRLPAAAAPGEELLLPPAAPAAPADRLRLRLPGGEGVAPGLGQASGACRRSGHTSGAGHRSAGGRQVQPLRVLLTAELPTDTEQSAGYGK